MNISIFGIIYILVTILFCWKKKWFTYWFVFSNTLFYSSVITIGEVIIRPYYVSTLVMFIVFVRGDIISRNTFREKDISSLLLFFAWIYVTFLCSFFLTNIIVIPNDTSGTYADPHMLNVTWASLFQTIYPVFAIFSYLVVKAYIKTKQDIKDFTKGYIYSFVPLLITVCILFTLRNVTHKSVFIQAFFSFINPTYTRNVADNTAGSIGDVARTFTYIGEASYTAKYYLMMLCLFASLLIYKRNTITQRSFFFGIILLITALIALLGSTTGYVGFVLLILLVVFLNFRFRNTMSVSDVRSNSNFISLVFIFGSLVLIPIFVIFYQQIIFFANYLLVDHVDKLEGDAGSGALRLNTSLIAINAFLKSPLFGVGYGHTRTSSYFTFLLSNVGIIGFGLLNFFFLYLIVMPLKKLKNMPANLKTHCMIYVTMLIITYFINFSFSGPVAIEFGWVWTNAAILARLINWRNLEDGQLNNNYANGNSIQNGKN